MDKVSPPGFRLFPQTTGKSLERLLALHFGFRVDQICQRFNLSEVEPTVVQRTPCEFTSLCKTVAGDGFQAIQYAVDDGNAAVDMKFDNRFASKTRAILEGQNQRFIEKAAFFVDEFPKRGFPRLRRFKPKGRATGKGIWPRHPDDSNA
ncbi:hypothetical protein GCM10011363_06600 [Marivita lacus]|uniref:Uncharacterized protein n=1 Tax=Marivita lacus TaxID=1323742 RepID=A0ABQ1KAB9_9RHOB|nr:hypothetical protein GCM10011363_06600 [Marivita lacus]